jgi:hypothetical protein
VFRGLNRLLASAIVAGAATTVILAGPSAALACNSGTSAVNVYKECVQTGGGARPTGVGTNRLGPGARVSGPTGKALSHSGRDAGSLRKLVNAYGLRRRLQASDAGSSSAPSAVGSAFDLGSGPTALLVALAGTALLLLGGSGVRVWRNRHHV